MTWRFYRLNRYQVDRATDTLVKRAKDAELDEETIRQEVETFGQSQSQKETDAADDYDTVR